MKDRIYSFPGQLAVRVHGDSQTCTLSGNAIGVGMESVRITRQKAAGIIRALREAFK